MARALPVVLGLAVLALLGWLILSARGGGDTLDRSVMGTQGLALWLRQGGIETRLSNPRSTPRREDLSLAILPLYDTDLNRPADDPADDAGRMAQIDPRDVDGWLVGDMAGKLPVLLALPKWRGGFAITGIAHEQTQVPPERVERLIAQTALAGARLAPVDNRITTARVAASPAGASPRDIALFRAQLIRPATLPRGCSALVALVQGVLVAECRQPGTPPLWVLSDPDILNNHGLALADNAAFALDMVRAFLAGDTRPVLLAPSPIWIAEEDTAEPHRRTGDDLSRFFAWPLSALWLMGAMVLGLAVWRGMVRFGPPRVPGRDAPASSRRAAIAAKARLLRLSGADARMAAEHARAHMADMAAQALGPGAANDAGVARWLAGLARRNPDLARDLGQAATIPPDTPVADLPRRLATLHALTRKAQDAA
jgi:hypothetical protein